MLDAECRDEGSALNYHSVCCIQVHIASFISQKGAAHTKLGLGRSQSKGCTMPQCRLAWRQPTKAQVYFFNGFSLNPSWERKGERAPV